MKRFFQFVLHAMAHACPLFTGTVLLYMLIASATGWASSMSFSTLLQFLAVSVAGTLLQCLAFTDYVFKRMRYTRRSLLFACLFLPLLSAFALGFRWFPVENASSWLIFLGIFLLIFVGMTAGFEVYFRMQGKKYDGLLGQYRRRHGES